MGWLWTLIAGAIIGVIAGAIVGGGHNPMGWLWSILAGLAGASVGQALFGHWGPSLAGMAVIPSILGAIIVVVVVSFIVAKVANH